MNKVFLALVLAGIPFSAHAKEVTVDALDSKQAGQYMAAGNRVCAKPSAMGSRLCAERVYFEADDFDRFWVKMTFERIAAKAAPSTQAPAVVAMLDTDIDRAAKMAYVASLRAK